MAKILKVESGIAGFELPEEMQGCGGCNQDPGTFMRIPGHRRGGVHTKEYRGCMGQQGRGRESAIDTSHPVVREAVRGEGDTPCGVVSALRQRGQG